MVVKEKDLTKKPKQFFKINNQSILEITVKKFIESKLFKNVIVVCPLSYKKRHIKYFKKI